VIYGGHLEVIQMKSRRFDGYDREVRIEFRSVHLFEFGRFEDREVNKGKAVRWMLRKQVAGGGVCNRVALLLAVLNLRILVC
jgi:hypothetical protein